MRRVALIPVVALTALISACTNATSGEPSPAPTPNGVTASGVATSPASGSLADLKACSLITDAEAQQVVPGSGGAVDRGPAGGSASDCQWSRAATDKVRAVTWGVTIRPGQTIDQVNIGSGAATSGAVGSHQARQVKGVGGNGTCLLSVAVGAGRVDFAIDAGLDSDQACDIASKVADIVEPKLPA